MSRLQLPEGVYHSDSQIIENWRRNKEEKQWRDACGLSLVLPHLNFAKQYLVDGHFFNALYHLTESFNPDVLIRAIREGDGDIYEIVTKNKKRGPSDQERVEW